VELIIIAVSALMQKSLLNTIILYTGFGLVLWLDLADRIGLEMPTTRAMLQIVSAIMGRDYRAEKARTLDTLGLGSYSMQELCRIL